MSRFISPLCRPPQHARVKKVQPISTTPRVVAVVPRGSDDLPGRPVDGDQRAAGGERVPEEAAEDGLLAAVRLGMLLPDQRIGRRAEERREILGSQRPQLQQLADEGRLRVERFDGHPRPLPEGGAPDSGVHGDSRGQKRGTCRR